jgi:hypothetical protein
MHSLIQSASDAADALDGEATRNAATAAVEHQVRRVTCCGEGNASREQLCRTKSSRHTKRIRSVRNERGLPIVVYIKCRLCCKLKILTESSAELHCVSSVDGVTLFYLASSPRGVKKFLIGKMKKMQTKKRVIW